MTESGSKFIDPSREHRAAHRARMHEEAHAKTPERSGPILEHALVSREKPQVIENDADLAELLGHLREAGSFAYDSEFIGELTYVPKLCLVQVATVQRVALIDPLAEVDLMPFWELICEDSVEKIVHAGDQDIEPVIRLTGRGPKNLVDTQVVAAFGGLAYPASLQKLILAALGFKLGKGLTFTHWDQRPLSAMQIGYAADDVRYLPALIEGLNKRAEAAGNLETAKQECAARCDPAQFLSDASEQYTRIRGAANLSRTQLAVLREMCIWRDKTAQAEDIPTRALLRDDVMIGIVRMSPKNEADVDRIRGMPHPVAKRFGNEIAGVVLRAHEIPAEQRPVMVSYEEGPAERFEIDALWAKFQCACFERQIDPVVAASRQGVADFYRRKESAEKTDAHPLTIGWRGEIMRSMD